MSPVRVYCSTASSAEPHAPQAAPYARSAGYAGTVALVIALLVSGCGGADTPKPSTAPSTAAIAASECGSLEDAVTAVTRAHPEIGLAVGSIPTQDQIAVMRDLVDGLEAVDLTNSDLGDLRRAMVVATQSIIDRGGSQEPLTQDDQGAFAGALTAASDYCGAITGTPTTAPPVSQAPASTGPSGPTESARPAGSTTSSEPATSPAAGSTTPPA